MGLRLLFKNLKYLTKTNLKQKVRFNTLTDSEIIEQTLYEIEGNHIQRPNILTPKETVERLVNSNASICRFGDGEISLIEGKNIPFEKASEELSEKLLSILQSDEKKFLIGINYEYYYSFLKNFHQLGKTFYRTWLPKNRERFSKLLNWQKEYASAGFNQLYLMYKNYDFDAHYALLRQIWNNKNITIIMGKGIKSKHKFDIFDNAMSINYIYGPNKNAFSSYDDLFKKAKQINKDNIIISMIGPAGKVLSYDLYKLGYRVLDLGHLAKDYDWYMQHLEINEKSINDFFDPD